MIKNLKKNNNIEQNSPFMFYLFFLNVSFQHALTLQFDIAFKEYPQHMKSFQIRTPADERH